MSGFKVLEIDEIPARTDRDTGQEWLPLRHALGVRAFGLNAFRARAAGHELIEPHDEADDDGEGHEELYVVVRGRARFTVDGDSRSVPAGTVVFVRDPRLERYATAEEPDTLVIAVGAQPGVVFEPSGWERRALALP